MSDDYRLTLELKGDGSASELVDRAGELEHIADAGIGDRAAVTHDGDLVYVYTDSEDAARRARARLQPLLSNPRYGAEASLDRWHPVEERWEPADAPLPETPEEEQAEHARREEEDREESRERGYPEWEVRLTLPNHRESRALADRAPPAAGRGAVSPHRPRAGGRRPRRAASTPRVCACRRREASPSGAISMCSLSAGSSPPHSGHR